MPEQKKRVQTFELPEYARDFHNLPAGDQEAYYAKFGLKSSIDRKLFSFLCQVIADAQLKTRRAVTSLKYYIDIVLKWASNPNNLRALQGFPRTEQTLKNNLNPLLQHLMTIGICRVLPAPDVPDENKYVALMPESKLGAPAAEKELEAIVKYLDREYDAVAEDHNHPLPSRSGIEAALKRPLNKELLVETVQADHCNRTMLEDPRFRDAHLIQVDFAQKYDLLLTPARFAKLPEIAARRMLQAIRELPSLAPLDAFLKEKFPAESTLSMKRLLEEAGTEGMPDFSGNCKVWAALALALMEEIKRVEKDGFIQQNKRIATYLTLAWVTHERNMELETGLETALVADLYEHIASHRRYMTLEELKLRQKAQEHIKRHGEEAFNELFTRFIQQHTLEANPEKAIIRLTGSTLGTSYIHSQHILSLFRSIPAKEKEEVDKIIQRFFVLPLSENLYREEMQPDVQAWYGDDAKIEERLRAVLHDEFDYLTDLHSFIDMHDFFAGNIQAVPFLCTRYHVAEANFLLTDGRGNKLLRPLLAMLDCTGNEILRRAERHVPLLRRFLRAFRSLFGGRKAAPPREKKTGSRKEKSPAGTPDTKTAKHTSHERKHAGNKGHGKHHAKGAPPTGAPPTGAPPTGGSPAGASPKQKLPAGGKTIAPEALYTKLAKSRNAEYYLGIWNRVLGPAAEQNKHICHAIIAKKVAALELRIKNGDTYVNVVEQAAYIAHAPQLGQVEKKEPLTRYIELILFDELEKARKAKNLRFEYVTTDK